MSLAIEENAIKMPVIALRGLVIFPEMLISFDVGRQKSAAALKYEWNTTGLFLPWRKKKFMLTTLPITMFTRLGAFYGCASF